MLISIRSTLKENKYSFKYIYIISTSNFFLRDTISFLERVNKTRVTCQLFGSVFLLLVQSMWTNSKWPAQHCRLLYQHCHRQLQPNWRKPAKTTDTVLSKVINIYITKFFLETSDRSWMLSNMEFYVTLCLQITINYRESGFKNLLL